MAIVRIEARKKKNKGDLPDWKALVGDFDDVDIAAAVDKANALPGSLVDPDSVRSIFPVLPRSLTAADLDFGTVTQLTVKIGGLIASQNWVRRDRLIWHIEHPGERNDADSPFVSLPIVAANNVIVDGHHALSALFLLGGTESPVWSVPIGLATGHPR